MSVALIIICTVVITLFLVFLLTKAVVKYFRELADKAIEVSCYVNTYHYTKDEKERIQIGQEKFYRSLFGDKDSEYRRDKTDYIFWVFYTQYFSRLLDVIPLSINMHNNRCLAEGEERDIEKYLDQAQDIRLVMFGGFASNTELHQRLDNSENVTFIEENNSDK